MNIGKNIELHNSDCMEVMARYEDNHFDLAIVDPPYGIGQDWKKRNGGKKYKETTYKNKSIPTEAYFNELKRVTKNYVIWGWNYYTDILGATNYLICWDKNSSNNEVLRYSKFELACTNIKIPANIFKFTWDGYRMENETGTKKIHPHQKPVALYQWLFKNYAKEGDKILDTHLGSGSIVIALDSMNNIEKMNLSIVGCELDKVYFDASIKRIKEQTSQLTLL